MPITKPLSRLALAALAGLAAAGVLSAPAFAAPTTEQAPSVESKSSNTYSEQEMVKEAGEVFGGAAQGMADAVHSVFKKYGEPNGYIKGEEASGAIIFGLRYGSGTLVLKNGGQAKVYWQGPSAGWDFGGDAVKVFSLVYNLPDKQTIYQRFPGVEGSAYLIGGIGVNYQQRGDVILAPMRSGVGLRLGAAVGYLKYTRDREWLPF